MASTCGIDAPAPDQVFRLLGNIGAGGPVLIHDLTTVYDRTATGTSSRASRSSSTNGSATQAARRDGVSAHLSTRPGRDITQPNSAYPDIPAGATGTNTARFEGTHLALDLCGTTVNLTLAVTADQGTFNIPFTIPIAGCDYTITTQTGQAIIPGSTDIGNHADDTTTAISFPFPVTVYGQTFTSGSVSSNGNLQLGTSDTAYSNECLPQGTLPRAFFPYWDDLRTDRTGGGIFTAVTGSPPNREYVIEWRTVTYASARHR